MRCPATQQVEFQALEAIDRAPSKPWSGSPARRRAVRPARAARLSDSGLARPLSHPAASRRGAQSGDASPHSTAPAARRGETLRSRPSLSRAAQRRPGLRELARAFRGAARRAASCGAQRTAHGVAGQSECRAGSSPAAASRGEQSGGKPPHSRAPAARESIRSRAPPHPATPIVVLVLVLSERSERSSSSSSTGKDLGEDRDRGRGRRRGRGEERRDPRYAAHCQLPTAYFTSTGETRRKGFVRSAREKRYGYAVCRWRMWSIHWTTSSV